MKRIFRYIFVFALSLSMTGALQSCVEKVQPDQKEEQQQGQEQEQGGGGNNNQGGLSDLELAKRYYVNTFLSSFSSIYYLWVEYSTVANVIKNWKVSDDPEAKVLEMRYKNITTGKDIDKWTQAIPDYTSFTSSVGGTSKTYGYDLSLMYLDSSHETIVAIVRLASLDSPAAKAGIKRGDVILKVNGKTMTPDNYVEIVNKELYGSETCKLTMYGGEEIELQAVEMYEDPVHFYTTYTFDGKTVGYLVFNSFTNKAYDRLIEAFTYFKNEGISELILDLRYNGGGYVSTETFLATLIAPPSEVSAGSLYSTTVYNSLLTQVYGNSPVNFSGTRTITDANGRKITYDLLAANPDIKKVYALMTSNSASASEAVVVGLKPYLDVEIIGQQSYGKYCTGLPYALEDFYDSLADEWEASKIKSAKAYGANWGIYVMIGRYADKNGETPCMPDGFVPDVTVSDNPVMPYQLGDENEALLHAALVRAGKTDFGVEGETRSSIGGLKLEEVQGQVHRSAAFGMRLDDTLPVILPE